MKRNVAVIFGGKSSEYEVSLSSSFALLSNIDKEKYNLYTIGITRDGKWYLYTGNIESIKDNTWFNGEVSSVFVSPDNGSRKICVLRDSGLEEITLDAVFPMLHGKFGEDGQLQGLFSVMGVPVVGCGHASSAVSMDKAMTKAIVHELGDIRQAASVTMRAGDDVLKVADVCASRLGYPMFVKPACAGSSVGISKVRTREELLRAMDVALREDSKVIIEEMITGVEMEVAVLEERGNYTVSVPAEIDVGGSDFYDYETKYVSDVSSYYIPARLTPEKTELIRRNAERIFRQLDCRGFSRVDFFFTPEGEFVFNEINTIPGFTPISMYPKLMIHSGISYSELIDRLISSALS